MITKNVINLEDSEMQGAIVSMDDKGDGKHVVVKVHAGGSGPFYVHFTIDMDEEKVTDVNWD